MGQGGQRLASSQRVKDGRVRVRVDVTLPQATMIIHALRSLDVASLSPVDVHDRYMALEIMETAAANPVQSYVFSGKDRRRDES